VKEPNEFPMALLARVGVHKRLSGAGLATAVCTFDDLVADQDERIADGELPSRIPLLWRTLADLVGLTVDNDGRIVDGPRADVVGL
jgi:hypothetical protein